MPIIDTIIAAALVSSVTAHATPVELIMAADTKSNTLDVPACIAQPELPWCAGVLPTGRTLTKADLNDAAKFAIRGLTFAPEFIPWGSYYDAARNAKKWRGDCVTVTFTALDYLSRQGVDMSNVRRALVSTTRNEAGPDHFVGLARIDGRWMVFGDTSRKLEAYPLEDAKFLVLWTSPINSIRWSRTTLTK